MREKKELQRLKEKQKKLLKKKIMLKLFHKLRTVQRRKVAKQNKWLIKRAGFEEGKELSMQWKRQQQFYLRKRKNIAFAVN